MSFKQFIKALNEKSTEGDLIKTIAYSIFTSALTIAILYFLILKNIESFIPKYGFNLFFILLSYSLIIPAIKQVRSYKEFPCMSGMMVGMTLGMISSFLPGFYLASTNGMFVGGFFGSLLGMIIGGWNGKCCGIMGLMEGIMAGFMGGLMGAMTAFMLLNDHLKIAAIIVFAVCSIIIISLNYMIFKESSHLERKEKETQLLTITLSFLLTIITAWVMIFGPRSEIFN
ncbi:MAG: hypothetical protein Q7S27_03100 [Nanoarchaeota archaeon]|nr:hypothetical protein [Nanoarchaeota archaeon]